MFFVASKVLWFFTSPLNFLIAAALIGATLSSGRYGRAGRRVAMLASGLLFVIGVSPVGARLIAPLEDRFPVPSGNIDAPYGIIVLGGAIEDHLGPARNQVSLQEGAARLTEGVALSRRFPQARLIYTGGSSALAGAKTSEADEAGKLWRSLGVDPARIELESRSRNTDENARFTRDTVHPEPSQKWLLVTSAYHMPRAMGLFRKAGFDVLAYPVDYRSEGGADWRFNGEASRGLGLFDLAVHEWLGLVAYRASGKIDDLFPGP